MSDNSKEKALVYTIEECNQCGLKTKRSFKIGDFVFKLGELCSKCKGSTLITMIYAEYVKT
jgi:rRNA maturation protein Nop10